MSLHSEDELIIDSPQRMKAIADETRAKILRTLEDGPASAKELAAALEMTHGKIGHHLKVLRQAGLIGLVEERPVRALTERFYGLTYDRLRFSLEEPDRLQFALAQAVREAAPAKVQPFDPPAMFVTSRISLEEAARFNERLEELVEEFSHSADSEAETVFGVAAAVFLTDTPRRTTRG